MIALVPCRTGSKRLPNKNFRELAGRPLVQWTIDAALESGLFDFRSIYVCTNEPGAVRSCLPSAYDRLLVLEQPHPLHNDECRDVYWVSDALKRIPDDDLMLLRVTSPFRGAETIRRAHEQWQATKDRVDSMRAMRRTREHIMKQWQYDPVTHETYPWMKAAFHQHLHSRPTQELADSYIQTAGLECFRRATVENLGTIAGDRTSGFLVSGAEALDLNDHEDWVLAEHYAGCLQTT